MQSKLCYICSPYRGDIERNTEYARELTRIALDCGYTPITPHLYLTQVLNEEDSEQREKGMAAGTELLRNCRYIFIGSRYGLSEGMLAEIQIALEEGITELAQEKGGLVEVYGGQQAQEKPQRGKKGRKRERLTGISKGSGKPVLRQNVGVVRAAKKLFEYEETGLSPYEVRALIEREKALTEKVKKMQDW